MTKSLKLHFTVSADHVSAKHACVDREFTCGQEDYGDGPGWYASAEGYGMSKLYPTPVEAIEEMLIDHACTNIRITPKDDEPEQAAIDKTTTSIPHRTYKTEFPDFDQPVDDLLSALPIHFDDTSWHNDTCPSFRNDAAELSLFIDYKDKGLREIEDAPTFSLYRDATNDASDERLSVIDTNDFGALVEAIRKIVALKDTESDQKFVLNLTQQQVEDICNSLNKEGQHFKKLADDAQFVHDNPSNFPHVTKTPKQTITIWRKAAERHFATTKHIINTKWDV